MQQDYYEVFNIKLQEFLNDLRHSFPDITDINLLSSSFMFLKNFHPKLPQQIFHEHVAKQFAEQILENDESFFLNYDYQSISNELNIDLDIVGRIKQIWTELNEDNKDAIWKYMKILVLINRKCMNE